MVPAMSASNSHAAEVVEIVPHPQAVTPSCYPEFWKERLHEKLGVYNYTKIGNETLGVAKELSFSFDGLSTHPPHLTYLPP